jgi:DNA-binding beta-propeller fold protein YncE
MTKVTAGKVRTSYLSRSFRHSRYQLFGVMLALCPALARADIAVSANDGHTLLVNGLQVAADPAPPDNVSVIDFSQTPPAVVSTVDVPASVVGPGQGVFVSKDESYAIVASASRLDPKNPKAIIEDNRVTVVDLNARPIKILQQVQAGMGADCAAVNSQETVVLVADRSEGKISVFGLNEKHLDFVSKIDLGNPKSLPSGIAFTKDGKSALVTRDDGIISVLQIDGTNVRIDPQQFLVGVHPYPVVVSPDGMLAAVANSWGGTSTGAITLFDLTVRPFRVVSSAEVSSLSEAVKFSPDGKFLAVGSGNGSILPPSSPFYHDHGILTIFSVADRKLAQVAQGPIGRWSQGVAFSHNGQTILVQNMFEKNISVFSWKNGILNSLPPIVIEQGGPGAIGSP